jgi:type VI secretion system protein VasJ
VSTDPDWTRVVVAAEAILKTHSKDLRVASALARAWWEGKGAANLVHSVTLVASLLHDHAADLHPLDPDARRDALDLFLLWLDERWAAEVLTRDPPARAALHAALRELCDGARPLVGADSQDLAACEALTAALHASLPPPTPAPEPDEPADEPASTPVAHPTPAKPAASSSPPPASFALEAPPPPADAEAARALLRQLRGRLMDAACYLRRSDPRAPLAYRLIRQVAWQSVDSLDLGPERLPWKPPPRREVDALERLLRGQLWAELIDLVEALQDDYPLWLDLQRHAVNALGQVGHTEARRDVEHEVRGLIARVPALPTRRFNDGTPLADASTHQWLAGLTAADGAAATTARPTDPAGLHAAAASAASGRERFLLRRELARACAAAGRPDVAANLLAALRDEARPLAAWEPALLADCLSELLRCGRTLDNEARTRLAIDHALAELSAHDPPVALALGRDTTRP